MIRTIQTESTNSDFQMLIRLLDNELSLQYGEVQAEYDLHNKTESLDTVIVAYHADIPVGCGCFKIHDKETVEIKRMFVRSEFRGKGFSKRILSELETHAAKTSYRFIVLETGRKQTEAIGLYKKQGYSQIGNYGPYIDMPNSVCFHKKLAVGHSKSEHELILKTERLLLRPVNHNDAESVFRYRSDAVTNQYQGWIPETIPDVQDFIESNVCSMINVADTWFQLVIISNEHDKLIGDVGIHFLDSDNMRAEIGCTLDKNFQGNGYAAEAVGSVIDYVFSTLDKHRITASIDPANAKSIRLFERLGFKKTALIRGTWVDDLVYSLLKEDWKTV